MVPWPTQSHLGRAWEAEMALKLKLQTPNPVFVPPWCSVFLFPHFLTWRACSYSLLVWAPSDILSTWAWGPSQTPGRQKIPGEAWRQQDPEKKNLDLFSPISLKHSFIILQDPPGEVGPDWRGRFGTSNPYCYPPLYGTGAESLTSVAQIIHQILDFCRIWAKL